ncbi:hypothetical protein [Clostridium sp. 1xD42-85]|uniref:hypothetical protein n=1 Tax=Clostridium sp. 1xD42-85 TaxID=2320084 RepID=UPI001A9ABBBC|nr:hypothetical protein [Clostridium sp. 1xD42-85]
MIIRLSGDSISGISKEDERQKRILHDAVLISWQLIMLYAFIRLLNLPPIFDGLQDPSRRIQSFCNGGDILLLATIGFILGGLISYFRHSSS